MNRTTRRVRRLSVSDLDQARALFLLMNEVFESPGEPLSDAYLKRLLEREDFWALAALEADELVGGLTAHTLLMTREESSEIFIYDIAVREDKQRLGFGRDLIEALRAAAAAEGIRVLFVPADNEDEHALDFYTALGGDAAPVTIFTFEEPGEPEA